MQPNIWHEAVGRFAQASIARTRRAVRDAVSTERAQTAITEFHQRGEIVLEDHLHEEDGLPPK